MNSGVPPDAQGDPSPAGGIAFGDVLFTLFRHKVLIFCSVVIGLGAAVVVRLVKPPTYESTAQIYIPYVVNRTAVNPKDPETAIEQTASGGDAIMNTEVEMLKSFDTAIEVATNIGPERILAKYGGGSNRLAAAGVIASGIVVEPPRGMYLTVRFSNRDPELVQPVMEEIVKAYMHRHQGMRFGNSSYFVEKAEEAGKKVSDKDQQIMQLKTAAGVPDIRERLSAVNKELDDLQTQVLKAQSELARLKAQLGESSTTLTNLQPNALPPDTLSTYSGVLEQIEEIKKRQRTLMLDDDLTTNHPTVVKLELKLQAKVHQRLTLEQQYPTLTNYISAPPRGGGGTNGAARFDLEAELASLDRLARTIKSDEETMAKRREEAFTLMKLEPRLTELERERKAAEDDYIFFRESIEKTKLEDNGTGGVINMHVLQTPTPPRLDTKKMIKFVGAAFGGCAGLGLGIAFLIDMLLDGTIRRPSQIVRGLRLPALITIPDANRKEASWWLWPRRPQNLNIMRPDPLAKDQNASNAVAPWSTIPSWWR
jgi:succinoglycan biosynthesis transport protein ExoP